MQVPGWQRGFPKGGLCMVKEKKKGMLICKRRQNKNQSYTCKKQVSLPDAARRRLYLHLRLQPKRLKPFPPSPKSPRRPNLLQLLTALKSELREDWREPSPESQISITVPQHPSCSLGSLAFSPCSKGCSSSWPAHHTQLRLHLAGQDTLMGASLPLWSCPQSRLTACKILHLPREAAAAHKVPPATGNSTDLCTLMQVWGFLNTWGEKEERQINPVILVDYTQSNYTRVMPTVSSDLRLAIARLPHRWNKARGFKPLEKGQ